MIVSLAPMQGYTDLIYRSTLSLIGGVDVFYAPYIKLENGEIKPRYLADIDPLLNKGMTVVPQMLVNNSTDALLIANTVADMGYKEVNLNLGCPFPMVVKRQLGAGLLPHYEQIDTILTSLDSLRNIDISVKMRIGLNSPSEVWQVVDVLNRHNIKEVILHPRIGKQQYKGVPDSAIVPQVAARLKHSLAYNGDIRKIDDVSTIKQICSNIDHVMIGRGLLYNPFLALEIKGSPLHLEQRRQILLNFVGTIAERQLQKLQGAGHFIIKMTNYWEYWSYLFANQHKVYKSIKKCKRIDEYTDLVQQIVLSYEWA